MDPCTGEGQNNFLSTIPKTERHATAETLSASSYKGHGHYCKEPLTRAWQSMERYGPPLAMQHGHHLHKWNFTSFEIMAEISTLSPFPIYLVLRRWVRVIVWEYFMRTGQSCLVSYNILYFFFEDAWSSLPKKSPNKRVILLSIVSCVRVLTLPFCSLLALRILKRLSLYSNQSDKPLCHKAILNSHLAANVPIYMATDLIRKRGENIHYITKYISCPYLFHIYEWQICITVCLSLCYSFFQLLRLNSQMRFFTSFSQNNRFRSLNN